MCSSPLRWLAQSKAFVQIFIGSSKKLRRSIMCAVVCIGLANTAMAQTWCQDLGRSIFGPKPAQYSCNPPNWSPWGYAPSRGRGGGVLFDSVGGAIADMQLWLQEFYGPQQPQPCSFYLGSFTAYSENNDHWQVFTGTLTVTGCGYTYPNTSKPWVVGTRSATCPAGGYLTSSPAPDNATLCVSEKPSTQLQMTSSPPVIPADSTTVNGYVHTTSAVSLSVNQGGQPVSGLQMQLQSNRGHPTDGIKQPSPTDASGEAKAIVDTYTQPGPSVISVVNPSGLQGSTTINWLPARYESQFLVTCYVLALESSAPAQPTSTHVCGLPPNNSYRRQFLNAVRMQGSGQALDGTIVHYSGHGCYNLDTCARTATGACATVGTTIATDPAVIPRESEVVVDTLGDRVAQDGGGWINGYHIDDYMGPQLAQCKQLGIRHLGITLRDY